MKLTHKQAVGVAACAAIVFATVTMPAQGAGTPSIVITSIKPGQVITTEQIPVTVAASNFAVECADVGKPGKAGQGHIHAMLDGMTMDQLTNFYCSDSFNISGVGLKAGKHVLAITLADDAHADVGKPAAVSFVYRPKSIAPLPAAMAGGVPSLKIVSPANGATVERKFDLTVNVKHFDLSCDLEGKRDVAGWGHLHVFVQQSGVTDKHMMKSEEMKSMGKPEPMHGGMGKGMNEMHGGMMSMVGMIGMPCTRTVPVDLTTWHSGNAHVLVMLASNDHMPTKGASPAAIDVVLK